MHRVAGLALVASCLFRPDPIRGDAALPATDASPDAGPDAFVSCVPSNGSATHYVDPALGTDDNQHGGAPGRCAYKTLTFALGFARATISLAPATYSAPAETFPILLDNGLSIACNGATLSGVGGVNENLLTVDSSTPMNTLDSCKLDCTASATASCLILYGTGTLVLTNSELDGNAVAVGVVGQGSLNASGDLFDGFSEAVYLQNSMAAASSLVNNMFENNTVDVTCSAALASDTGTGNTEKGGGALSCTQCANCPFP